MADTKIEMKVDEEIKPLNELCEKMTEIVKMEIAKGVENVDTKELGYAIDMIKDLADAKAKTVEACYHKYILVAMEENEGGYGEIWDEEGPMKGYRSQPRSKTSGRFMSYGDGRRSSYVPEMYNRDMPTMMGYSNSTNGMSTSNGNMNGSSAMNYNDGYSKGYEDGRMSNQSSMSRMEKARRGYDEVKHIPNANDSDKQKKATKLHELMQSVIEYVEGIAPNMSNEEKTVLNHDLEKMRTIATK